MAEKLTSGKELLDDYFVEIENLEGTDPEITAQLKALYESGKLTEKAVINFLTELRSKP